MHDLDIDPAQHGADYHMVTGVREHDGRVWMGSLHEPAIAVYDPVSGGPTRRLAPMSVLPSITGPRDLRDLTDDQLDRTRQ